MGKSNTPTETAMASTKIAFAKTYNNNGDRKIKVNSGNNTVGLKEQGHFGQFVSLTTSIHSADQRFS